MGNDKSFLCGYKPNDGGVLMAEGFLMRSVNVLCEKCGAVQDVPLVRDNAGYYHNPKECVCDVCGRHFLINGRLCAYGIKTFSEVFGSDSLEKPRSKHLKIGYSAEAAMMVRPYKLPDLMVVELLDPREIDCDYAKVRERFLKGMHE